MKKTVTGGLYLEANCSFIQVQPAPDFPRRGPRKVVFTSYENKETRRCVRRPWRDGLVETGGS